MSITTFSELKTAIGNWMDRTDLSARIPEFISLFEAKINRRLAVRQQVTTTTLTPTAGVASLPADYLMWKRVTWTGDPKRSLEYVDPDYLQRFNATSESGTPLYFTIEGSNLTVAPIDNTGLTFAYAQKVPALSDGAPTNWLLTAHPDAYLFGSLTMSATFTEEAQSGAAWNALTEGILGELWASDFRHQGPMTIKTLSPTP
jgi:hypothetical protein